MLQKTETYNLVGDELLISVFSYFQKGESLNFKSDSNIMLSFYKASKMDKYSNLFTNYHFDEDGAVPYSEEVANGIFNLRKCELVERIDAFFGSYRYRLSKGIDIRYEKFIAPKLSPKQTKLIEQLAKEIAWQLKLN